MSLQDLSIPIGRFKPRSNDYLVMHDNQIEDISSSLYEYLVKEKIIEPVAAFPQVKVTTFTERISWKTFEEAVEKWIDKD